MTDRKQTWVIVALAVFVAAIGYEGFERTTQNRNTLEKTCRDMTHDRVQTARLATALENYYREGVLAAKSVKGDVKKYAAKVENKAQESGNQLRLRLLRCDKYVEGEEVLDERLLREAKGDL